MEADKENWHYLVPMKVLFCLLWSLGWSLSLMAQVCNGNLGENIFTDGDFGRGLANTLPNNPNIAPGYTYTNMGPPFDGFYTITNNTGGWPGLFATWLAIGDNSPDPNGYMMVVNASLQPGLFYEQQVDGLCENTLYQFTADIINLIRVGTPDHIDPNVSFLLNGDVEYSTGLIPKTNSWNTYGFTFVTLPGQTSVTLSLRNNAPGGNGNDLAIDNISFRACGPLAQILPEAIERICEDGQFTTLTATIDGDQYPAPALQWQRSFDEGQSWVDIPGANDLTYTHTALASGFYYYRYLLANGGVNLLNERCRVVSNSKVVEVVPKLWTVADTICQGTVYETGGSIYDRSGIYVDTLLSSLGCDSIVTLQLIVEEDSNLHPSIVSEDPPCVGQLGRVRIDSVAGGLAPYTYIFNAEDSGSQTDFTDLAPASYSIRVVDRIGCGFDTVVNIQAPLDFQVDLGPDQQLDLGQSTGLQVVANDLIASSQWIPAQPDCAAPCDRLSLLPTQSGVYSLQAISQLGCLATDSIRISVVKVRQVYIPSAFSPNFDGVNDYFYPLVGIPNVQQIVSLQLYNRWGAIVYEVKEQLPNNGTSFGWDGTYKGRAAEAGTYVYKAEIRFLDGEVIQYSGDVLLLP